jgi:hypothetical protein
VGIEPIDRKHHPDIAFSDQLADWQTISTEVDSDLYYQPEMAGDQAICCVPRLVFAPALGECKLFLGVKPRKFAQLLEIASEISIA